MYFLCFLSTPTRGTAVQFSEPREPFTCSTASRVIWTVVWENVHNFCIGYFFIDTVQVNLVLESLWIINELSADSSKVIYFSFAFVIHGIEQPYMNKSKYLSINNLSQTCILEKMVTFHQRSTESIFNYRSTIITIPKSTFLWQRFVPLEQNKTKQRVYWTF